MLKASIIGNIGNDPDLRYSANGVPLLRFNVASNYRTRTQEGEYQDRTEWVRVTVVGNRAESISPYLKKGMKIYVDGRLEARPWVDQQEQIRSGLEVMANEIQFVSPREDGQGQSQQRQALTSGYGERESAPAQRGREPVTANQAAPRQQAQQTSFDDDVDNLPF